MASKANADPEQQYTNDGERENPEQQMPNIGSDPVVPREQPAEAPDTGDDS
jgi:hypothetical protein